MGPIHLRPLVLSRHILSKTLKNASFMAPMERCQSGRMGLTRNQVCGKPYRGFESLPFRDEHNDAMESLYTGLWDYLNNH